MEENCTFVRTGVPLKMHGENPYSKSPGLYHMIAEAFNKKRADDTRQCS